MSFRLIIEIYCNNFKSARSQCCIIIFAMGSQYWAQFHFSVKTTRHSNFWTFFYTIGLPRQTASSKWDQVNICDKTAICPTQNIFSYNRKVEETVTHGEAERWWILFGKCHCFYLLVKSSLNLKIEVLHQISFAFIAGLIMLISLADLDAVWRRICQVYLKWIRNFKGKGVISLMEVHIPCGI